MKYALTFLCLVLLTGCYSHGGWPTMRYKDSDQQHQKEGEQYLKAQTNAVILQQPYASNGCWHYTFNGRQAIYCHTITTNDIRFKYPNRPIKGWAMQYSDDLVHWKYDYQTPLFSNGWLTVHSEAPYRQYRIVSF